MSGQKPQLDHGSYFPGKLYQSDLTMEDIILESNIREQIKPIGHYIKGEIAIISELPYCMSCQGVIQDFGKMFPNVK